ncbi:Hypothetical protein PBC10988_11730 [Planctomycetales bacterium 10988]|nr:Hypothetical protein PBC10988_11730 [Planctomycetales bacterium 10988]
MSSALFGSFLVGLLVVVIVGIILWKRRRSDNPTQASRERTPSLPKTINPGIKADFERDRKEREAEFLAAANASGRPRGLRWVECDWAEEVIYALDRRGRNPVALVQITVRFEAIPGGGMEEVEAVSRLRAATALFNYLDSTWQASGRAIFNFNPEEILERFSSEFQAIPDMPTSDTQNP